MFRTDALAKGEEKKCRPYCYECLVYMASASEV